MWLNKRVAACGPGIATLLGALALGAGGAAADAGQTFPLTAPSLSSAQPTYGTVQLAGPNGAGTSLSVSLNLAAPNATYYVRECSYNSVTAGLACVGDQTDTLQTDALGAGTATLAFPSLAAVDLVQVYTGGYSGSGWIFGSGSGVLEAATSANTPAASAAGLAVQSNGTFFGPSATVYRRR